MGAYWETKDRKAKKCVGEQMLKEICRKMAHEIRVKVGKFLVRHSEREGRRGAQFGMGPDPCTRQNDGIC